MFNIRVNEGVVVRRRFQIMR